MSLLPIAARQAPFFLYLNAMMHYRLQKALKNVKKIATSSKIYYFCTFYKHLLPVVKTAALTLNNHLV